MPQVRFWSMMDLLPIQPLFRLSTNGVERLKGPGQNDKGLPGTKPARRRCIGECHPLHLFLFVGKFDCLRMSRQTGAKKKCFRRHYVPAAITRWLSIWSKATKFFIVKFFFLMLIALRFKKRDVLRKKINDKQHKKCWALKNFINNNHCRIKCRGGKKTIKMCTVNDLPKSAISLNGHFSLPPRPLNIVSASERSGVIVGAAAEMRGRTVRLRR